MNAKKSLWDYPGVVPERWMNSNYYDIIQVHRDAPMSVIKKSFRKLLSQVHPDRYPRCKKAGFNCKCKLCRKNRAMSETCKFVEYARSVLVDSRCAYDVFLRNATAAAMTEAPFRLGKGTEVRICGMADEKVFGLCGTIVGRDCDRIGRWKVKLSSGNILSILENDIEMYSGLDSFLDLSIHSEDSEPFGIYSEVSNKKTHSRTGGLEKSSSAWCGFDDKGMKQHQARKISRKRRFYVYSSSSDEIPIGRSSPKDKVFQKPKKKRKIQCDQVDVSKAEKKENVKKIAEQMGVKPLCTDGKKSIPANVIITFSGPAGSFVFRKTIFVHGKNCLKPNALLHVEAKDTLIPALEHCKEVTFGQCDVYQSMKILNPEIDLHLLKSSYEKVTFKPQDVIDERRFLIEDGTISPLPKLLPVASRILPLKFKPKPKPDVPTFMAWNYEEFGARVKGNFIKYGQYEDREKYPYLWKKNSSRNELSLTMNLTYDYRVTSDEPPLQSEDNTPSEGAEVWDGIMSRGEVGKAREMKLPVEVQADDDKEDSKSKINPPDMKTDLETAAQKRSAQQLTSTKCGPTLFDLLNMVRFWVVYKDMNGKWPTRAVYIKKFGISNSALETLLDYALAICYGDIDLRSVVEVKMKLKKIRVPLIKDGRRVKDEGKLVTISLARFVAKVKKLPKEKNWKRANFAERCLKEGSSLRQIINV